MLKIRLLAEGKHTFELRLGGDGENVGSFVPAFFLLD